MQKSLLVLAVGMFFLLLANSNATYPTVAVTVNNLQSSSTGANFPQMVNFDHTNTLFQNMSTDYGNVRFYAGATELYSWKENASRFWVKIPAGIGATSQIVINMTFLSIGTEFDGVYAGEAPQLSAIYAQYDNGKSVFPILYTNFTGTSTPSGWASSGSGVLQNNGISLVDGAGGYFLTTSTFGYSNSQILDMLFNSGGTPNANGDTAIGFTDSSGYGATTSAVAIDGNGGSAALVSFAHDTCCGGYNSQTLPTAYYPISKNFVLSIYNPTTGTYVIFGNYSHTVSSTNPALEGTNVGMVQRNNGAVTGLTHVKWIRIRTYPPAGVMPTVTFSAGTPPPPPTSVAITYAVNPIIYGSTTLVTATCVPSSDTCRVEYPIGTSLCTATGTCSVTTPILAVGSYVYYANDLTLGTNTVPNAGNTLVVNKAQVFLTLSNCTNTQYTAVGFSCTTTAGFPTISNQITGDLNLNGGTVATSTQSSNSISYTVRNMINEYTFVATEAGNGNYLSNSIQVQWMAYVPLRIRNWSTIYNEIPLGNYLIAATNTITNWNYPIYLYTQSPSNTITYSLYNSFAANSPLIIPIQHSVLNISFVPSTNTLTGQQNFLFNETQAGNTIGVNEIFNPLTMNVINVQPTNTFTAWQYLPVLIANTMSWYSKPQYWLIDDYANTLLGNTIVTKGSNTLTLPLNIKVYYSFTSFNLTANLGLTTTSLPLTPFLYVIANSPTAPYTREVMNISTYDQQFFFTLPTNTTVSFGSTINGWNLPNYANSFDMVGLPNNFQVYAPLANSNPNIYLYNQSMLSRAADYFATVNNYCPTIEVNGTWENFKPYLPSTINSSLYAFSIYQGTGYGATNYTMLVQTGASVGSLRQVQSYLISSVPFALPLINGQQYKFILLNQNCQQVYSTALTIWSNPITIYLPFNSNVPELNVPQINASCKTLYNSITSKFYVSCSGIDTRNFVNSWNITVSKGQNLIGQTIVNATNIAGSSFTWNWTIPDSNNTYTVYIKALVGVTQDPVQSVLTYLAQLIAPHPLADYAFFFGIVLLFTVIAVSTFSSTAAVILSIFALLIGQIMGIFNLTQTTFEAILIIGGVLVYWKARNYSP